MQIATRSISARKFLGMVAVLGCLLSVFPILATAQGAQGQNAVYPASGVCCKGSPAFIDASQFLGNSQGVDLCDTINGILGNRFGGTYPSSGTIIDARGISGSALTCTLGSPWTEGGTTVTARSTILLPAGTIIIPGTWVLPNYTRLIGAGDALDYLSTGTLSVGTTLQACLPSVNHCSSSFSGSDMIDLGTSQLCPASVCNSVSVENLTLDGLGQSLNGIVNTSAKTGSHVDHVS